MNAIQKSLDDLKYRIPQAILQKTFLDRLSNWRLNQRQSLDELIRSTVIKPRVLVDCNLIGGVQALIDLSGLPQDRPTEYFTVIHIPKERTQGRSINSVLNLGFIGPAHLAAWAGMNSNGTLASYGSSENSALMAATSGMLTAFDKIPMVSTSRVELIAENTVLVRDSMNLSPQLLLRCVLSNDDELNDLQVRSYRHFSTLVEYAVKSYIYNTLIINMDQAELQGGQALGRFKDVVDGYSEAEQNYQDFLKNTWEAVAFMQDETTYMRYMKLIVGGNR